MKFLQSASFFLAALAVSAQRVSIGYPVDGTAVSAGQAITVEIDRPDFLSSATEVAVVIGAIFCGTGACPPASELIGPVLYNGPYKPPHQNFTVTLPDFQSSGRVQLNVMHVSLIGASGEPFLETLNVTLNYTA